MPSAYIFHPDCALHEISKGHPESPARIRAIHNAFLRSKLETAFVQHEAQPCDRDALLRVHVEDYVNLVFDSAPKEGSIQLDPDTAMNPHSLRAALLAAGAVCLATDTVLLGDAYNAFCNVRPPGHHAEQDKAMGFCLFNSVAVGVAKALEEYGLTRVAVVDFDVHHGNGTENSFANDDRVFLCQSFQSPFYPFTGRESETGHIANAPLSEGCDSDTFRRAYREELLPALEAFRPECIFISAGFDAHKDDPLAGCDLEASDYQWVTEQICGIAMRCCQGRVISSLEGGYNIAALSGSAIAHMQALADAASLVSPAN